MRTINFYVLHPKCKDVKTALEYLFLEDLKDKYDFVWNPVNPDYVIATEHLYASRGTDWYKIFLNLLKIKPITIFFAGEAMEPDFNIFDYAVGYSSRLSHGDRYALFPSCFLWANRRGFINKYENNIKTDEDVNQELEQKKGFCNFLYSNYMAHPNRDLLFYIISKYKKVDSLGRHLNNVGKKGTGYVGHAMDCIGIKNSYKFSISSENAQFCGYTSEKILTSLEAHTVPIYWGDPDIELNINPDCFINCNKFNNLEEVVEKIREVDENDELWKHMVSAPWRTAAQITYHQERMANYINLFNHIFTQEKEAARRKAEGTMPEIYKSSFERIKLPSNNKILLLIRAFYNKLKYIYSFRKYV